jgi:hypothetical protein
LFASRYCAGAKFSVTTVSLAAQCWLTMSNNTKHHLITITRSIKFKTSLFNKSQLNIAGYLQIANF